MRKPKTVSGDLREACVREAMHIIGESGVESLSLRDLARRLNVSHQAPYKHFPSRDHLLAEIVSRTFKTFADYLDAETPSEHPQEKLGEMGLAYLNYALENPLNYRLMFGTPLPDTQLHPEMMKSAQHAFSILRDCIARMSLKKPGETSESASELDALFVWATMHGISSILQTRALDTLSLPPDVLAEATRHILLRIGSALEAVEE